MRRNLLQELSAVRSRRLLALISGLMLVPLWIWAADFPAWWQQRGVIGAGHAPDDYAALNQGQLKHFATAAYDELNARLTAPVAGVTGAGPQVEQLIKGWFQTDAVGNFVLNAGHRIPKVTVSTDDYAAVNLGQLKTVAAPFYARLIAIGYAISDPWNAAGHTAADDYALANLGQTKNLFNFSFTSLGSALDSDHNGLPDWWEQAYFGHLGVDPNAQSTAADGYTNEQELQFGRHPVDFYQGQTPVLTIVYGQQQTTNPGAYLPSALSVAVSNAQGQALTNAPVAFTVTTGGGTLQATSGGSSLSTLAVRSKDSGQAKVFYRAPNQPNQFIQITASAGSAGHLATVVFAAGTDNGSGPAGNDPFAPSQMSVVVNRDGSADMTWENNTDNETSIEITVRRPDNTWETIATLPPQTTSYHLPTAQ